MPVITRASEFLSLIESCKHLDNTLRVDPNVYCYMHRERDVEFIATDENDWFGMMVVQWPTMPSPEAASRVDSLLRQVGDGKLRMLFNYQVHEASGIIRAVYRLPIYAEFFGQDDVDHAVMMLYKEWSTISPFIRRVLNGENVDAVAIDTIPAMEAMRNQP